MQFQNESKAPKLMCFEPLKASPLSLPLLTLNYNGHAVLYVQWFLPNNFSANYMKEDRTPSTPPRSALGLRRSSPASWLPPLGPL